MGEQVVQVPVVRSSISLVESAVRGPPEVKVKPPMANSCVPTTATAGDERGVGMGVAADQLATSGWYTSWTAEGLPSAPVPPRA
jgi:hypothetical protein